MNKNIIKKFLLNILYCGLVATSFGCLASCDKEEKKPDTIDSTTQNEKIEENSDSENTNSNGGTENKDDPNENKDDPNNNKDNPNENEDNPGGNDDNPNGNEDNPGGNEDNPNENKDDPNGSNDNQEENITLGVPVLKLQNDTVSWEPIENATSYCYYINESNEETTNSTSIKLNKGESISVCAEHTGEKYIKGEWSTPVSYAEVTGPSGYVNVAFRDAGLSAVTIEKGKPYNAPSNPTKEDYIFEGWYKDPFFKETYNNGASLYENTVLYAKWTPVSYLNDACYWVKASKGIHAPDADNDNDWKVVPLKYDYTKNENNTNYYIFSTYVEVTEESTYVVTNTTVHTDNSEYWKKPNGENFTLHSAGYYKIEFSVEYAWEYGDSEVHCHASQVESNPWTTIASKLNAGSASELYAPVVSIDKENNLATWIDDGAAKEFEYQIDNGEFVRTTANSAQIFCGSFIIVRSIAEDEIGNSKWSRPYSFNFTTYPTKDYSTVYFYDACMNSQRITNGEKVDRPADPIKHGFTFGGWYKELSCKTPFNFDSAITKNTVIYPKWTRIDEAAIYHLIDGNGTKLADLKYYSDEHTFNEYKCKFETSAPNTTIKVVDPEDYSKVYLTTTLANKEMYTMYYSPEKLWDAGTDHALHAYIKVQQITYYFTRPNEGTWAEHAVRAYAWGDNGKNKTWPGETAEYIKKNEYDQEIYKYTFNVSAGYKYIIFNDGDHGAQSQDLPIANYPSGTQFWLDSSKEYGVGTRMYS